MIGGFSERPVLIELFPNETRSGEGFNIQPDGRAALAVRSRYASAETVIVFRGVGLPTVRAGSDLLTAFVPSELYSHAGAFDVHLRDLNRGESNRLTFRVLDGRGVEQPDADVREVAIPMASPDPSLLILVLHFGSWPEWLPLFLETCRWNPTIHWLIITDCETPEALPANVRLRRESLATIAERAADKMGYVIPLDFAYKLCDLRLAFGRIFDDLIGGYDFFGWSDLDVVYGDLRARLGHHPFENDVVTFYEEHLSGHLTLVRNTSAIRDVYLQVPEWPTRVRSREYEHLDEPSPDLLRSRFPVWARQSYNTPFSPYVPWRDGTFRFPTEWYWRQGHLWNDLDGDTEFLYLHFMHWKGGPWPRECGNAQWERLDRLMHFDPALAHRGFRINERGFFLLEPVS